MSSTATIEKVLTIPAPDKASYDQMEGGDFGMLSLRGNILEQSGTFLSRMNPGAVAPWHWHSPTEEFVVVKGAVLVQLKGEKAIRLEVGGYTQLPANRIHRFRCDSDEESIVFVVSDGAYDLHWVDEDGNEISEEEANRLSVIAGRDW